MSKTTKKATAATVVATATAVVATAPKAEPKRADFRSFTALGYAYAAATIGAVEALHILANDVTREYARDCFKVGYIQRVLGLPNDASGEARAEAVFARAPWHKDNAPSKDGRARRTKAEHDAYMAANSAWHTISHKEGSIGKVGAAGRKPKAPGEKAAEKAGLPIGEMATLADAAKLADSFRDSFMAFSKAVREKVKDAPVEADDVANQIFGLLNKYARVVSGK